MSDNGNKPEGLEILKYQPISAWPWPRIILFVPMFPALPYADRVFYQFMRIATQGIDILEVPYGRNDLVRNIASDEFRKPMRNGEPVYTHLLMLDADHTHPVNIVQRLARRVIEDPTRLVVGGLNYKRTPPFTPCAFVKDPNGGDNFYSLMDIPEGIMEVDALGSGSILVAREVFDQLEKPYWFYNYGGADDGHYPGVDIGFSSKCREAGIKLWCDTTVTSPHMGEMFVDGGTHKWYWENNPDLLEQEEILEVET